MAKKTPNRAPPSRSRAVSKPGKGLNLVLITALEKHLDSLPLSTVESGLRNLIQGVITRRPASNSSAPILTRLRHMLDNKGN